MEYRMIIQRYGIQNNYNQMISLIRNILRLRQERKKKIYIKATRRNIEITNKKNL